MPHRVLIGPLSGSWLHGRQPSCWHTVSTGPMRALFSRDSQLELPNLGGRLETSDRASPISRSARPRGLVRLARTSRLGAHEPSWLSRSCPCFPSLPLEPRPASFCHLRPVHAGPLRCSAPPLLSSPLRALSSTSTSTTNGQSSGKAREKRGWGGSSFLNPTSRAPGAAGQDLHCVAPWSCCLLDAHSLYCLLAVGCSARLPGCIQVQSTSIWYGTDVPGSM
ncbi:hypothetical protein F5884DRAFT_28900 [Xylogone sp. PMI_703]|nr:hypothetical protein F5884DRAFT_28900 [Xylogone sp. PMI_703]